MYKSAEFDHTTATESIVNTLTTVLGVVAIGAGLTVISGELFGFAVPGYIATAGQVAGGILTAKDIGHLITGKDINGNPLSETDKEALMGSLILDATMVGVNSLNKLKLKYANKVNKVDGIEGAGNAVLENASYAQKTYSNTFSAEGRKIYSNLAGKPINTIDDLVSAINSGKINVADLPVEYIVRDGNTLILNTRTSQALTQAGIPRSQWNVIDRTGNSLFEELLTGQLTRNKLSSEGISTVRPSGGK